MYKQVKAKYGKVILGKDMVCPGTEHRGWGRECKTLTLKENGYHCDDCGLVYQKKLERYEKMDTIVLTAECDCKVLEEVIEWWMDELHGYECPSSRLLCRACGRHYKIPPISELEKQQSEGGKRYVSDRIELRRKEHAEKLSCIKDQVCRLVEALKEVSAEERQELLNILFT